MKNKIKELEADIKLHFFLWRTLTVFSILTIMVLIQPCVNADWWNPFTWTWFITYPTPIPAIYERQYYQTPIPKASTPIPHGNTWQGLG